MYKIEKKRRPGYFRVVTRTVLTCDGCGREITYSSSPKFDEHYCEKCYKKLKEQKNDVSTTN